MQSEVRCCVRKSAPGELKEQCDFRAHIVKDTLNQTDMRALRESALHERNQR